MADAGGDSPAAAEPAAAPEQPAEEVIVVQGAGGAGPRAEWKEKGARKRPRPGRETRAQDHRAEGDMVEGQEKYERGQGVDLKVRPQAAHGGRAGVSLTPPPRSASRTRNCAPSWDTWRTRLLTPLRLRRGPRFCSRRRLGAWPAAE